MSKDLKKYIKNYLSEDKRVNKRLNHLIPVLNQAKDPVHQIKKRIKQTNNPLKLFKALILIHICYIRQILNYKGALKLLSYIKPKQSSKMYLKKVLGTQVIPKYKLYLQMCYQSKIQQHLQQKQMQENSNYCTQPIQEVYKTMGLLKHGLDFVDILFLFGRYYRFVYLFIIDFNIVLAKDIQIKYHHIATILNNNKSIYNEVLIQKLQKLHEQMFIVYYNCYYVSQTKRFQPKWIQMDEIIPIENMDLTLSTSQYSVNYQQLVKLYEKTIQKTPTQIQTTKKKMHGRQMSSTKGTIQVSRQKKIQEFGRQIHQISQFQPYQHEQQQICYSGQQQQSNQKLNQAACQEIRIGEISQTKIQDQQTNIWIPARQLNYDDIDIENYNKICGDIGYLTSLLNQNNL